MIDGRASSTDFDLMGPNPSVNGQKMDDQPSPSSTKRPNGVDGLILKCGISELRSTIKLINLNIFLSRLTCMTKYLKD